jgi:hypothetical protein
MFITEESEIETNTKQKEVALLQVTDPPSCSGPTQRTKWGRKSGITRKPVSEYQEEREDPR